MADININQGGGNFGAVPQVTGLPAIKVVFGDTSPSGGVNSLPAGEAHLGNVGGITPRITGQVARPADNTAYSIGDIIANSGTAASVVPITFTGAARISGGSGVLTGCRCTVLAASGTIVLPAFDLLIFRPVTSIPFAAAGYPADNAALNVSAAAFDELVAIYAFTATAWRNQAGGATATGDHIYQAVGSTSNGRTTAPFNLASIPSADLVGILQAQNTWTPTGVVNTIKFVLDIQQD